MKHDFSDKSKKNMNRIKVGVSTVLAFCLLVALLTSSVSPKMLKDAPVAGVTEAPTTTSTTAAATETTTETTTKETTTEKKTTEKTTKKVAYKAKTDVVTKVATGNKKTDEDKGNDKVSDSSLTDEGSGDKLTDHQDSSSSSSSSSANSKTVKSEYTDYVYVNTSSLKGWQTIDGCEFYFDSNHKPLTGMQKIGGRNYYFNKYGGKASLVGIDVSQWNGSINWSKVKEDGVDFAIIRVGFRGYGTSEPVKPVLLDTNVETNIVNAKKAGLDIGLYFYSQAITLDEALEEAGACVNFAKKYGIQYPIYFDTEYSNPDRDGRADSLTKTQRTNIALAFCEAVKNAGYKAGIYASKSFYYDELNFSKLSSYNIWVAHYTSKETDFKYDYKIWQYSSTGSVSGISGDTDLNISLYDYAAGSSMSNLGSDVVMTDKSGIQEYVDAEDSIAAYEKKPTDANYEKAENSIEKVSDSSVKKELLSVLEKLKK